MIITIQMTCDVMIITTMTCDNNNTITQMTYDNNKQMTKGLYINDVITLGGGGKTPKDDTLMTDERLSCT